MLQIQNNTPSPNSFVGQALDDEGFILDPYAWEKAFSQAQAFANDIELHEAHWQVIELIRDKYLRLGALPPMRIICKSVGLEKQEMKKHFGSCIQLWKIAGLPNPGQEAISYMN